MRILLPLLGLLALLSTPAQGEESAADRLRQAVGFGPLFVDFTLPESASLPLLPTLTYRRYADNPRLAWDAAFSTFISEGEMSRFLFTVQPSWRFEEMKKRAVGVVGLVEYFHVTPFSLKDTTHNDVVVGGGLMFETRRVFTEAAPDGALRAVFGDVILGVDIMLGYNTQRASFLPVINVKVLHLL